MSAGRSNALICFPQKVLLSLGRHFISQRKKKNSFASLVSCPSIQQWMSTALNIFGQRFWFGQFDQQLTSSTCTLWGTPWGTGTQTRCCASGILWAFIRRRVFTLFRRAKDTDWDCVRYSACSTKPTLGRDARSNLLHSLQTLGTRSPAQLLLHLQNKARNDVGLCSRLLHCRRILKWCTEVAPTDFQLELLLVHSFHVHTYTWKRRNNIADWHQITLPSFILPSFLP